MRKRNRQIKKGGKKKEQEKERERGRKGLIERERVRLRINLAMGQFYGPQLDQLFLKRNLNNTVRSLHKTSISFQHGMNRMAKTQSKI